MKYIKEVLEITVKESLSISDICKKMNIKPVGGNYKTIKKYINLYGIDKSHFTGQGWNTGDKFKKFNKEYDLEDILIENSNYTNNTNLKKKLLSKKLIEYKCNICNLSNWMNKKIVLHLDHINGDNLDNRLENLRLLCPNCHSQTDTYCGKNQNQNQKEKEKYYCDCGNEKQKKSKMCRICQHENSRKVKRPSVDILNKEILEFGYKETSKKYGVSDNAIRKWVK